MEYLIVHKSGKKERFEDAATAWYSIDDRYPGAYLRRRRIRGRGIFAMHDISAFGHAKVCSGRRIVARITLRE